MFSIFFVAYCRLLVLAQLNYCDAVIEVKQNYTQMLTGVIFQHGCDL